MYNENYALRNQYGTICLKFTTVSLYTDFFMAFSPFTNNRTKAINAWWYWPVQLASSYKQASCFPIMPLKQANSYSSTSAVFIFSFFSIRRLRVLLPPRGWDAVTTQRHISAINSTSPRHTHEWREAFESNLAAAASVQAAVKTNMSYRNDTIVVVSSQLTQIKAMLMLLWPLI